MDSEDHVDIVMANGDGLDNNSTEDKPVEIDFATSDEMAMELSLDDDENGSQDANDDDMTDLEGSLKNRLNRNHKKGHPADV